MTTYEPPALEIFLTLTLGTLAGSFYRQYVDRLPLRGNETVLDFGSGSGVCSKHLARRLLPNGRLLCVDSSRGWNTVIRRTMHRYANVAYHLGDIGDVSIPPGSCDAIYTHFVLHDIPAADRERVVRALAGKLKPGGQWFVREPLEPGMRAEDLRLLLTDAGFREGDAAEYKHWYTGPLYEGVFAGG